MDDVLGFAVACRALPLPSSGLLRLSHVPRVQALFCPLGHCHPLSFYAFKDGFRSAHRCLILLVLKNS